MKGTSQTDLSDFDMTQVMKCPTLLLLSGHSQVASFVPDTTVGTDPLASTRPVPVRVPVPALGTAKRFTES